MLLHSDSRSRESIIATTAGLGIAVNFLIAVIKIIAGMLASSIAIVSEGLNSATDTLTSALTLAGTKLAGKHPDQKHPFGYGRIEYLTGLVIACLILITGTEILLNSVKLIFHPAKLNISYISLTIVAVSAVIKFLLGLYTIQMGRKAESGSLEAVGIESRNDSFVSLITIFSAVVFLVFHVSIDACAGIFTSLIILKAGLKVLGETISQLLGKPGKKELAIQLYKEIRSTEGILNAADMMLHNYGPDTWSGSVNIEMDHKKTIGEMYQLLHKLQLHILHEYKVTLVFGIYAVDHDHDEIRELRKTIGSFVKAQEHAKSFHAVYLEPETNKIYCDIVVDYELRDWDVLRKAFTDYMGERYPESEIELTVETEFV